MRRRARRRRARRWFSVVIVEHRIKLHQSGIERGFKSGLELVVVRPVVRGHRGLGVVGRWEVCCCTPGKWFEEAWAVCDTAEYTVLAVVVLHVSPGFGAPMQT